MIEAADGQYAAVIPRWIASLVEGKPCVIFLDLMMPVMSGDELILAMLAKDPDERPQSAAVVARALIERRWPA